MVAILLGLDDVAVDLGRHAALGRGAEELRVGLDVRHRFSQSVAGYLTATPRLIPAFAALLRGEPPPEGIEPLGSRWAI